MRDYFEFWASLFSCIKDCLPVQRIGNTAVHSQTGPWVHGENLEQRAQNNNDGEVLQIKEEQQFVVHPLGMDALHVRNKSEASQSPGDPLDPAQDLRQCEGPGDVDQGITNFVDFNKYISKVGGGIHVAKFKCNICGQIGGKKKWNLRKHVENTHFPGQFVYSCPFCEGKFDTMQKYYNHQTRKHSNTY